MELNDEAINLYRDALIAKMPELMATPERKAKAFADIKSFLAKINDVLRRIEVRSQLRAAVTVCMAVDKVGAATEPASYDDLVWLRDNRAELDLSDYRIWRVDKRRFLVVEIDG